MTTPRPRETLIDEEHECGCCGFYVGSSWVSFHCAEHGGGSYVLERATAPLEELEREGGGR